MVKSGAAGPGPRELKPARRRESHALDSTDRCTFKSNSVAACATRLYREDKETDVRKRDDLGALKEAEALWDSRPGSPESDRLEVLALLIQAFESGHYPIPEPDPIELLLYVMESRGLTRKDLES